MGKNKEKVSIKELREGSRRNEASRIRARIPIGLVKTQGVVLAEVARRLGGLNLGDIKNHKTCKSASKPSQ